MSRRTQILRDGAIETPSLSLKVPMKLLEVLGKLSAAFIVMLTPIHPVLISVGVLILADAVFGIWAAYKRGEQITSKRMGGTIVKLFVYNGVIVTGYLVQTHLLSEIVPVVKICAGYIGMVELKSLLENSSTILGRDLFKEVIDKLGSKSDKNPTDPKA